MKKVFVNLYLDIAALLCFLSLFATGVILYFALPHRGPNELHGFGRGENAVREFAGLAKHSWSDVHFYVACLFTAIIVVHFILHFEWLKGMLFKKGRSAVRSSGAASVEATPRAP